MQPKTLITVVFILLILGIAGYFALGKYQQSNYVASITPLVKNTSIRTSNMLDIIKNDTPITVEDFLDKLNSDIKAIDANLLQLQTLSGSDFTDISAPAVDYLKACQDGFRYSIAFVRGHFESKASLERTTDLLNELQSSTNPFFIQTNKGRLDQYLEDSKLYSERSLQAKKELVFTSKKVLLLVEALRGSLPADSLIDANLLKDVASKLEDAPSSE